MEITTNMTVAQIASMLCAGGYDPALAPTTRRLIQDALSEGIGYVAHVSQIATAAAALLVAHFGREDVFQYDAWDQGVLRHVIVLRSHRREIARQFAVRHNLDEADSRVGLIWDATSDIEAAALARELAVGLPVYG